MIRKRIFCNYIGCHNRKRSQSNPDDVVGLINRNDIVSKDSLVNLQDASEGKHSLFDSQWPAADDLSRGSDDRDYVARPEDDVNSTREKMAKIASVLRALEENLRQRYHSIKRRQVSRLSYRLLGHENYSPRLSIERLERQYN